MEYILAKSIIFLPIAILVLLSILNTVISGKYEIVKSRLSTGIICFSLISFISCTLISPNQLQSALFINDHLSVLMTCLILFISFVVHSFSIRYMFGEKDYSSFFTKLSFITLSLLILVNSNNLYVFFISWIVSNILLLSLINFKEDWNAANKSTSIISNYLLFGSMCLFVVVYIFNNLGIHTFTEIIQAQHLQNSHFVLALLLLSALVQCSLIPFHGYLLNSLNAPTPVSALMHASLVNGGGFLLVRFSPLFVDNLNFMNILFLFGALSAFFGVLWMLIKVDIKGILASSTISQMGFMFMQIGLGLFPAAVSHLCMHGLFKSYLFLSSGSALSSKAKPHSHDLLSLVRSRNVFHVIFSTILAMSIFINCLKQDISLFNTSIIFVIFVLIFFFDIALNVFKSSGDLMNIVLKYLTISFVALIYGSFLYFVDHYLAPSFMEVLYPINLIHCFVLGLFLFTYLSMIIKNNPLFIFSEKNLLQAYAFLVNSSQPSIQSATLTKKGF